MRLLILGASGGCGRWLTRLAHERGHDVAVLVRPQSDMHAPAGVKVHTGDVADAAVLNNVLPGNDAVLCALGCAAAGDSRGRHFGRRRISCSAWRNS